MDQPHAARAGGASRVRVVLHRRGDVVGRVLFNRPIKGTPEIVSYSIVVICYLQAAYAIRSGGMINTDAITAYLPVRMQNLLGAFGALLGVILFGIILLLTYANSKIQGARVFYG